jgi:hypothetical protein
MVQLISVLFFRDDVPFLTVVFAAREVGDELVLQCLPSRIPLVATRTICGLQLLKSGEKPDI